MLFYFCASSTVSILLESKNDNYDNDFIWFSYLIYYLCFIVKLVWMLYVYTMHINYP